MSVIAEDIIFTTNHFILGRHPQPFVSREDGGHVRIFAKRDGISERRDLTPKESVEFIWFSSIVGEALEYTMNQQGINVVKINFEELGNWAWKRGEKNVFHEHIFGRASDAGKQVFPEAIQLPDRSTGFYDDFTSLTVEDMQIMRTQIKKLMSKDKYNQQERWTLT